MVAIATCTAEHLAVKVHVEHTSEIEVATKFEDTTWHCEHHNLNLNYAGRFALSETAIKAVSRYFLQVWTLQIPTSVGENPGVDMFLGDGSDEQFGGYPTFVPDFLQEPDLAFPHGAFRNKSVAKSLSKARRKPRDSTQNSGAVWKEDLLWHGTY